MALDFSAVPGEVKEKAQQVLEAHQARHPHHHLSFAVEAALQYLNGVLDGFGVEGTASPDGGHGGFQYVNMGRSCTRTVVFDHQVNTFRWGVSWEDVLAEHEGQGVVYP